MDVWGQFAQVYEQRHQYAEAWKARTGHQVLGYLCTYVPEEIIHAAGLLPVRVLGSHEPEDITGSHIFNMFCPYCRDCLAQGLQGRYHYLSGMVHGYACVQIRQTYDSWTRHVPTPFSYFLYVPDHLESPSALAHVTREMGRFKAALEAWLGKPISSRALKQSIQVYNENRRLLQEIYERRKANPPPLSGAEAKDMVLACMLMDKEEHSQLLRQALKALDGRRGPQGIRLLLIGSENDDPGIVRLIESLGGVVVTDDDCIGTRHFWGEVPSLKDPLAALARRYIEKPLCPVKDYEARRRLPYVLGLAQDYHVQGAIFLKAKFCDPHEYDWPATKALLESHHIPCLALEYDTLNPTGVLRTRIEAFLEMLQVEVV